MKRYRVKLIRKYKFDLDGISKNSIREQVLFNVNTKMQYYKLKNCTLEQFYNNWYLGYVRANYI